MSKLALLQQFLQTEMQLSGISTFGGTSYIRVLVGTTDQRPTGVAGDFRYNTTTGNFKGYTDSWGAIVGSGGGASESDTSVSSTSATSIYNYCSCNKLICICNHSDYTVTFHIRWSDIWLYMMEQQQRSLKNQQSQRVICSAHSLLISTDQIYRDTSKYV